MGPASLSVLVRDPLVHFLLLGAVAWGLWTFLAPEPRETLAVDAAALEALEAARVEVTGRPLTNTEREEIVAGYLEDEVLVREALRRGLDRSDSRVRERLLGLMRASLDEPIPDPAPGELESYFEKHLSRYWERERLQLEHLAFPEASPAAPEDPAAFLAVLQRGDFEVPADPLVAELETRSVTPTDLERVFGPQDAERILALPARSWGGPFASRGTHFVRILERQPVPRPTFEDRVGYVRADWEADRRRAVREEKVAEMLRRYRVVLPEETPR